MSTVEQLFRGAVVVEAGLDYLTMTTRGEEEWDAIERVAASAIAASEARGNAVNPAAFQAYAGYAVSGCFVGTRKDGGCLRLSGPTAHRYAPLLPTVGINVSHIDTQVTVRLPEDRKELARELVDTIRAERAVRSLNPRRGPKLVDDGDNGSSAYIGHRLSATYGRVYDKGREAAETFDKGCWRLETEWKRKVALPLYVDLASGHFQPDDCAAITLVWMHNHGVHHGIKYANRVAIPDQHRMPTDLERCLQWMRKVVRPAVKRWHEAGYATEVADALYDWQVVEEE